MSRSRWLRGVVTTVLMATCVAGWGQQALPPLQQKVNLDIPSQPVAGALTALGRQSGLTIMLAAAAPSNAVSPAVVGDYTPDEALRRILESSGLKAEYLDQKTVKVAQANSDGQKRKDDSSAAQGKVRKTAPPSKPTSNRTEPTESQSEDVQEIKVKTPEILVMGSRVMNVDVQRTENDVQPYTILTSEQIQKSGATSVEDFLKQQLTMNTTVQTSTQAYGTIYGATSSINLRGLGANETLVLIDGRRAAGISVQGSLGQPDINGIPLSAIERIEVLPSSASAIYGGAAVGGVVNIILKRNFSGGDLGFRYDIPEGAHAPIKNVDASLGLSLNEDRTQLMIAGHYSDGTPLLLRDRQVLTESAIAAILANNPAGLESPSHVFLGATPNIAASPTIDLAHYPACSHGPTGLSGCLISPNLILKGNIPLHSPITYISAGTAPGSQLAAGLLANAGSYNLNPSPGNGLYSLNTPFGTVPLTKSVLGTVRQSLFDDVKIFGEFSTGSNSTRENQPPFTVPYTVPASAPTNPFTQSVQVTFPTNVSTPATSDSVTHSATVGVTAPLIGGWRWEADYTLSKSSFEYEFYHTDTTSLATALRLGAINPFVDTIAYPLFLSPYLIPNSYSGDATLNDVSLRTSGTAVVFPGGNATLTIGVEHRKEGSHDANLTQIYPLTPANNLKETFFGQSQSTNSVYAELIVPLLGPQNSVRGVESLDLQIAGRAERYKVFTGTPYAYASPPSLVTTNPPQGVHQTTTYTSTNPTIGFKYQPIDAISVRASYARAFLPPTAAQLLANPTPVPGTPITDPKNGQSYAVSTINGGNPHLKPQTSRDWDVGVIWEPNSGLLQGTRLDVEYYRIDQPNYITSPIPQQVVSDSALSDRVTRDAATGLITTVNVTPLNATEYKTSGWDFRIDYRRPTPVGTFGVQAMATWIRYDLRQYQIGAPFIEFAGYPGDGGEGKLKGNATLSWERGGWTAAWTARYFSSYWQDGAPGSPATVLSPGYMGQILSQGSYSIPAQVYHDVFIGYVFEKGKGGSWNSLLGGLSLQMGVQNVLNSKPPFDEFYSPYYYSPYGDPRLRDYRFTIKKAF